MSYLKMTVQTRQKINPKNILDSQVWFAIYRPKVRRRKRAGISVSFNGTTLLTDFFVYLDSLMLKKAKNRRDARIRHLKPPKPLFLYKGHQFFFYPRMYPIYGPMFMPNFRTF